MFEPFTTNAELLVFNGLQFLPLPPYRRTHPKALFPVPGGIHGWYRQSIRGIHLYKLDGQLEAYLVSNDRQGRFAVSAYQRDGANHYMFSTSTLTERWLRIEDLHLSQQSDLIRAIEHLRIRMSFMSYDSKPIIEMSRSHGGMGSGEVMPDPELAEQLAVVANSRSASREWDRLLTKAKLVRPAADTWLSLTLSGKSLLQRCGYRWRSTHGWVMVAAPAPRD